MSRAAVPTDTTSEDSSGDNTALIATLTSCLVVGFILAGVAGWYIVRKVRLEYGENNVVERKKVFIM